MKNTLKFIPALQIVSLVIAILLVILSILLSFVDGVAIIFSYISLLFALLALSQKNIKYLKFYGLLFVVSHVPLLTMVFYNMNGASTSTPELPNFSLFEKCSNEMFNSKDDLNQKLTTEDQEKMAECLNGENMPDEAP